MTGKSLFSALLMLVIIAAPDDRAAANMTNERSYQFSESAIEYFKKGDYRSAIIQLRNAIQQDPRNPAARVLLGRSYLQLGQGHLAEREFLNARRIGAHPDLIVEPLGRAYLLQKKYKEIFDEIKPGRRGSRVEALIQGIHGRAYLILRDLEMADASFAKAAQLQPRAVFPLLGRARVMTRKRQLDSAEKFIDRALKLAPKNANAWYGKAEIQLVKHQHAIALKSYDKAIDLKSNHIPARIGRAAVLIELKRDNDALKDIKFVRGLIPSESRAAYMESIIYTRQGRFNEAQAVLTEAENYLKKRPPDFLKNDPSSLLLLGVIGFARKNYEESYQHLKRYIELDPSHPGALKIMGAILLQKGEPWSAIKMLRPAVRLVPNDFEILTLLANAHMRVKEFAIAAKLLEKASGMAPDRAKIRTQLGLSRLSVGQVTEGVDDLETALSLAPDGSQPGLLLGLYHLKRGDYDKALLTARSIEKRDPRNPFSYNLSGAAELGKGNKEEARKLFENALQIDPNYVPAYTNLAKIDIAAGDLDAAKDRYTKILRLRPNNIKAMRSLADLAILQKDLPEAIRLLKEIGVLDPNATQHQVLLVRLFIRQKRLDAALNLARDLEIVHPTDPAVLEILGHALLAADKYQEAANRYHRVAEITRQDPKPLLRVALLQERARDFEGARETLRKAIALDPNYLPVQVALIRLEERRLNLETAMELVSKLRQEHPEYRGGDMVAGSLLMRAKRYDEAVEAYTAAYTKENKLDAVQRLYEAKYRAGKIDEAFSLISNWVEEKPRDLGAKRLLASAYRRARQMEKAIKINESLLTLIPDDPALLNNLAGLYHLTGDKRARAYAEKAYKLAPRHPIMLDTFGWILVATDDAERGLTLLRQAFTRAADNPEVLYHLAVALQRTGHEKEAKEEIAKALDMGLEFEGIQEARALLRKWTDG